MSTYKPCTSDPPVDVETDETAAWRKRFNRTCLRHPDWALVVLERGPTPENDDWRGSL